MARSIRVGKYKLIFGRTSTCDVLLISSGYITDLAPHCAPANLKVVEIGVREIIFRPTFLWHLGRFLISHSRQAAVLGAYVRQFRAKTVICFDNIPNVFDWAGVLPMPLIVVQHGMRQMEDDLVFPDTTSNVVLLSWGELEVDDFRYGRTSKYPNSSHNRKPCEIVPIGSLRDSLYRSRNFQIARKVGQLCLISQFKGFEGCGLVLPKERKQNLDLLGRYVNEYALNHKLDVLIALYSDTSDALQIEKEWYRGIFGGNCMFNDPSQEFATYRATDESIVSVGVHTSVLWEVFGRGKRMLACNFTGHSVFKFPVPGPWYLHMASYEEFEARLTYLITLTDAEYSNLAGDKPKYLISYSEELPTHEAIRSAVMKRVSQSRIS